MKTSYNVILSLAAMVAAIIAVKGPPQWPSVLTRCSMDDPQFEKCLKKATIQSLQRMAKGMPVVGIRPLDPLRNVSFSIVTGNGPISVTVYTNNVMVTGPSKVQVKKVSFDKKTSTYWVEGLHNQLKMVGNYRVHGNILVFPIDSAGTFEFEVRGGFANHSLRFRSTTRDVGHGQVGFTMKTVKGQKIHLRDTKLGVEGSDAVNRLVNEHWESISEVLWNPMERVVTDLYTAALKPFTKKFTVNDFFPPTLTRRSTEVMTGKSEEPVSYSYSVHY